MTPTETELYQAEVARRNKDGVPAGELPSLLGEASSIEGSEHVPVAQGPFPVSPPRPPFRRNVIEDPQDGFVPPAPASPSTPSDRESSPTHAALEARTTVMSTGAAKISVEGGEASFTAPPSPTTAIGKAVFSNKAALQLTAFSLRATLDAKLERMRDERSNSEDQRQYEDLRRLVDEFLVASIGNEEDPIIAKTLSLADCLRDWWAKDHVSICNKALNIGLLGSGLAICGLAGALGPISVATVGALVGGKDVVAALESCVKLLKRG
jgi:hypothetical protein